MGRAHAQDDKPAYDFESEFVFSSRDWVSSMGYGLLVRERVGLRASVHAWTDGLTFSCSRAAAAVGAGDSGAHYLRLRTAARAA